MIDCRLQVHLMCTMRTENINWQKARKLKSSSGPLLKQSTKSWNKIKALTLFVTHTGSVVSLMKSHFMTKDIHTDQVLPLFLHFPAKKHPRWGRGRGRKGRLSLFHPEGLVQTIWVVYIKKTQGKRLSVHFNTRIHLNTYQPPPLTTSVNLCVGRRGTLARLYRGFHRDKQGVQ